MPLQASQAIPEKPRNRGGEDQEQISQEPAGDWKHDRRPGGRRSLSIGEREVQKTGVRSSGVAGVQEPQNGEPLQLKAMFMTPDSLLHSQIHFPTTTKTSKTSARIGPGRRALRRLVTVRKLPNSNSYLINPQWLEKGQ
jgi:hypothetical protein